MPGCLCVRACVWLGVCIAAAGCSRDSTTRILADLASPDVAVRREAARKLDRLPTQHPADSTVVAALLKATGDDDEVVQHHACRGLGTIGPAARSAVPALEMLLDDPQPNVRAQAALAIARIQPDSTRFIPVLAEAMRRGDGRLLLEVGAIGPPAHWAVPTLIDLLSHRSASIRALAAQTLGQIRPDTVGARRALQQASRDTSPTVRAAAEAALKQLSPDTTATR